MAKNQSSTRRRRLFIVVLVVLPALAVVLYPRPEPSNPNVILVTVDTLRADRLGAYGHGKARTPVIDGLAARGLLFENATTPFPRTTPALASLLTGLWPQHHGSREVAEHVRPVPTLAEILKRRGYATVGVSANGAAGANQKLDRGFDHFLGHEELKHTIAKIVTDRSLELVAAADPETPVFLWVHYVDPHSPYLAPREWKEQPAAPVCRQLFAYSSDRTRAAHVVNDRDGMSSRALEDCKVLYDAVISYTDFHIGRLLDGLSETGRLEDTIVVFTADHGENLGEWGLFYQHGPNVHEAGLRVPLIMAGPGIRQGVDPGVARLEDVTPTLLGLLDEPRQDRPTMDGVDLSRRLGPWARLWPGDEPLVLAESGSALLVESFGHIVSGRARQRNCTHGPRFSLCGAPGEELLLYDHLADPDLEIDLSQEHPEEKQALLLIRRRWPPEQARQRTARNGRFKLVEFPRREGGYRRRLYDLETDPGETRDVSARHPKVVDRLQAALDEWAQDLPSPTSAELTRDELEVLRSLGYID